MSKQTQTDKNQSESTINQDTIGEKKEGSVQDQLVETQHTVTIDGNVLNYTVTTGTIVLKDEDEKEGVKSKASVFFVAYTKNSTDDDPVDISRRPLTISFNGGPGSSSGSPCLEVCPEKIADALPGATLRSVRATRGGSGPGARQTRAARRGRSQRSTRGGGP